MTVDSLTDKKARFLEQLRAKGTVFHAAHEIGVSRQTVYNWRNEDPEFAKEWDQAKEDNLDTLEQSLYERAVHGVEKPVYQGGQLVGHVTEYSDTAAIFMLKGGRPQKYRERYEHTGAEGTPLIGALAIRFVNSRESE